ncbi:Alternative oxidase, mitochondrial [Symbiodinium microadriaticum]|uniref:Alternative oxidase, mitochondrial n=1 Tax=Symbiodinium microadriaticum TaxID=2951 RepID=A0A1Q9EX80_SYMMI|nr:Alternative oxidase, mitochondrial [Symbiodinium microadriaticum]
MASRAANSGLIRASNAAIVHRRQQGFTPVPVEVEAEAPWLRLSRDAPQWQLPHNVWSSESICGVRVSVMSPGTVADRAAYGLTKVVCGVLDMASGFKLRRWGNPADAWLRRLQLFEAASAVPVDWSLRALSRPRWARLLGKDRGWLRALSLQEEQVSLHQRMVAAVAERPMRSSTVLPWAFGAAQLLWPRFGKWCVDHAQDNLLRVYDELLQELDNGLLPDLSSKPAPFLARQHYALPATATVRDVIEKIHLDDRLAR